MAELDTSSGGGHKGGGVKKSKKMSTRVDLTPMVDLGFLLITFFMFATTLSQPKAAKFKMPKDDVPPDMQLKMRKDAAMNVLLGPPTGKEGETKRIYYYEGDDPTTIAMLSNGTELRKKLLEKKKYLKENNIPDSVSIITIKPLKGATYGDFMMVRDEYTINSIGTYMRVKPDENEVKVIDAYNLANNIKLEEVVAPPNVKQ
jgi:Biopolymer transport protein ExbD/TolR